MICRNLYAFEAGTCISLCGTDKGTVSIRFRTWNTRHCESNISNIIKLRLVAFMFSGMALPWSLHVEPTLLTQGMQFCKQVLKGYLLDMPCMTGDGIYPVCFSNARFGANTRIAKMYALYCIYNYSNARCFSNQPTHLPRISTSFKTDSLGPNWAQPYVGHCTTSGPICCWHWSLVFARRLGPRHAVGRAPMRRFSRGSAFTSFRALNPWAPIVCVRRRRSDRSVFAASCMANPRRGCQIPSMSVFWCGAVVALFSCNEDKQWIFYKTWRFHCSTFFWHFLSYCSTFLGMSVFCFWALFNVSKEGSGRFCWNDWPGNGGDWPGNGEDWPGNGGDWPGNGGDWPEMARKQKWIATMLLLFHFAVARANARLWSMKFHGAKLFSE